VIEAWLSGHLDRRARLTTREPTGETTGPMTRAELTAQFRASRHGKDALCWHVDVAEWQPLARVASGSRGATALLALPAIPLA
jgi:hypothetical protein